MELGLIGLGRMGANMSRRLLRGGHQVVGYARHEETVNGLVADGSLSAGATSLEDLVKQLPAPRAVWLMVPAAAVDDTLAQLVPLLAKGDIVIDGGNSYYGDDIRRAHSLVEHGVHYVDCGTSGGVFGLERGYCLMIGGPDEAVARLDPIFATLAPRHRRGAAHGGSRGPRRDRRGGLPPLRPERRRPLRQDGPQRHRVRDHGRLRRGPQRPAPRQRRRRESRRSMPRRAPCATRSSTASTWTWPT